MYISTRLRLAIQVAQVHQTQHKSQHRAPLHVCNENSKSDNSCDSATISVTILTNYAVDLTIPYHYNNLTPPPPPYHFGASKSTSTNVKGDVVDLDHPR